MKQEPFGAFATVFLPWMADIQVRGLILLALTGFVFLLMRRSSAARRHLVLSLTVLSLLALLPLSLLLPSWSVAVPTPLAPAPSQALSPIRPTQNETAPKRLENTSPTVSAPLAAHGQTVSAREVRSAPEPSPARTVPFPVSTVPLIAALVWGIGALILLLRLGLGVYRLLPQARQTSSAADATAPLLIELTAMLGLRKSVRLLIGTSDRPGLSPMTWGFFRPVILLPAEAAQWSPERLRPVLLHELAHIQRGDWANELLAQGVCALYWPNPFVWLLARRLRTESESPVMTGYCSPVSPPRTMQRSYSPWFAF